MSVTTRKCICIQQYVVHVSCRRAFNGNKKLKEEKSEKRMKRRAQQKRSTSQSKATKCAAPTYNFTIFKENWTPRVYEKACLPHPCLQKHYTCFHALLCITVSFMFILHLLSEKKMNNSLETEVFRICFVEILVWNNTFPSGGTYVLKLRLPFSYLFFLSSFSSFSDVVFARGKITKTGKAVCSSN